MKKFNKILCLCFALFALVMSFTLVGCGKNNDTSSKVKYTYITYKKERVNSGSNLTTDLYKYTFQVDVENNTDEDVYITSNSFEVNGSRVRVFYDEAKLIEVTMSTLLPSGEKQSLYIEHECYATYGEVSTLRLDVDGKTIKEIIDRW